MKYIGLDVHKINTAACVINAGGKEVRSMTVSSQEKGLQEILKAMEGEEYMVLMESSTYSIPVYRFFQERGVTVHAAHAKYLKMITQSDKKTDSYDASALARYLRSWDRGEAPLSLSYIPTREEMRLKDLCRLREDVTGQIGDETRKIKAHMVRNEQTLPFTHRDLKTIKSRRYIAENFGNDITLNMRIEALVLLLEKAKRIDQELQKIGNDDGNVRLLISIPGIGVRSAVQIMSMIIDIGRFEDSEKLCSYFGLVPRVRSSGGKEIHGHMTKAGDPMMRCILDRVTYVHVCHCRSSITAFYERKAAENKKKALTSASRKMLCTIYAVLKRRTPFTA